MYALASKLRQFKSNYGLSLALARLSTWALFIWSLSAAAAVLVVVVLVLITLFVFATLYAATFVVNGAEADVMINYKNEDKPIF